MNMTDSLTHLDTKKEKKRKRKVVLKNEIR